MVATTVYVWTDVGNAPSRAAQHASGALHPCHLWANLGNAPSLAAQYASGALDP